MALRYTLRQLEYLVAVGQAGSVVGAAQRENVSPPSVSAAIAHLERELGVALFVRLNAQGLVPTPAGQAIIDYAQATLRHAAALRDRAAELSGRVHGPLAIGCLSSFAQVVLPGLRRRFAEDHPQVRITQREADQAELFSQLRQGRIDLALTYDLDLPTDLRFVPMLELPPLVAMAEDHPLADRAEVSVEDLAPHPMVLLDLPCSADYFLSFFAARDLRAHVAERTRDMAVMRSLVANGFGYSIVNVRPRDDLAPDGRRLRFVPLAGRPRPMRMGLLLRPGDARSPLHRAFLAAAAAWLSAEGRRLCGLGAAG